MGMIINPYLVQPSGASIVTDGLILNLDAGNSASYPGTGTTWTDLSGNGNNATLVNGVGYSSSNGGYLTFDGSNDYALGTNVNISTAATLITWFKTSTSQSNKYIFNLPWISGGSNGFDLAFIQLTDLGTNLSTTTQLGYSKLYSVPGGYNDNVWRMLVATYDGSNLKLFINGSQVGSSLVATGTIRQTVNGEYNVGRFGSYGAYGIVDVASVNVYNRALNSTEITQNFDALKSRYGL